MKHIASILDYILLLDYEISNGNFNPRPKKESQNLPNMCATFDEYLWYPSGNYWYKTPFKAAPFGNKSLKKNDLSKLLRIWLYQIDLLRKNHVKYNARNLNFVFENYGQIILDYCLTNKFFILTNDSLIQLFSEIIKAKDTEAKLTIKSFYFGHSVIVTTTKLTDIGFYYKNTWYSIDILKPNEELIIGFLLKPKNIFLIDQIINSEQSFGRVKRNISGNKLDTDYFYKNLIPINYFVYDLPNQSKEKELKKLLDSETLFFGFITSKESPHKVLIDTIYPFDKYIEEVTKLIPPFYRRYSNGISTVYEKAKQCSISNSFLSGHNLFKTLDYVVPIKNSDSLDKLKELILEHISKTGQNLTLSYIDKYGNKKQTKIYGYAVENYIPQLMPVNNNQDFKLYIDYFMTKNFSEAFSFENILNLNTKDLLEIHKSNILICNWMKINSDLNPLDESDRNFKIFTDYADYRSK